MILNQSSPVHVLTLYRPEINFNIIIPPLSRSPSRSLFEGIMLENSLCSSFIHCPGSEIHILYSNLYTERVGASRYVSISAENLSHARVYRKKHCRI